MIENKMKEIDSDILLLMFIYNLKLSNGSKLIVMDITHRPNFNSFKTFWTFNEDWKSYKKLL